MDYNTSIPDIYNEIKINKKNIEVLEYYIKSYEEIKLPIKDIFYFLYFQTNSISLIMNNDVIWNNKIYFGDFTNKKFHKVFKLFNKSDLTNYIKIYIIYQPKLLIQDICYPYYTKYETENSRISLITQYCGYSYANYIYIKVKNRINNDIIKINSFNLILYYKVKELYISDDYCIYYLIFTGIENSFYNDTIVFDNINNINDIDNIVTNNILKLKKFMENNKKYIIINKIELPNVMKDMDGWRENIFYNINYMEFTKKYKITHIDIFETKIC